MLRYTRSNSLCADPAFSTAEPKFREIDKRGETSEKDLTRFLDAAMMMGTLAVTAQPFWIMRSSGTCVRCGPCATSSRWSHCRRSLRSSSSARPSLYDGAVGSHPYVSLSRALRQRLFPVLLVTRWRAFVAVARAAVPAAPPGSRRPSPPAPPRDDRSRRASATTRRRGAGSSSTRL